MSPRSALPASRARLRPLAAMVAILGCAAPERSSANERHAAHPGASLEDVASRLVGTAVVSRASYDLVADLCDTVGARLSGSPGAEKAVRWAVEILRKEGFRVRTEKVMVPRWVRGEEKGEVVSPYRHELYLTALGGSVATPEGGLEAEVIEARDLEHLATLGERVRGRLVFFNKQISPDGGEDGYGAGSRIRVLGPSAAAKQGAVGMILRSLGTAFLRNPHTGMLRYEDGIDQIPAVAVTAEDADLIHRLLARKEPVRVRLRLGCETFPDVESHNVVADWPGRERPDEIVLIGAHLDSWDLGVGAVDDASGVAIVMETLRLYKRLGLRPRRTVRVVLFMNEENGLRGARAYAEDHRKELAKHVVAIEADSGAGRPLGFSIHGGPGADKTVERLAKVLRGIQADAIQVGGHGGADISVLEPHGIPLMGLRQDTKHYFDWHHSPADTVDKVDPQDLALCTAAMATMAYGIADFEEPLARTPPTPPAP